MYPINRLTAVVAIAALLAPMLPLEARTRKGDMPWPKSKTSSCWRFGTPCSPPLVVEMEINRAVKLTRNSRFITNDVENRVGWIGSAIPGRTQRENRAKQENRSD